MVSKQFSFRLPDEVVEWLEGLQLEGESLNQTTQRFIVESSGLSTASPKHLSTVIDIDEFKQEVRSHFSQLEAHLEELRGKLKAR